MGHQAVLRRAVEEGARTERKVVAATFDPHPRTVLRPGEAPGLLTTLELRREALLRYGAQEVFVIEFDEELSRKDPEEFVREVLVGRLGAGTVVVGQNFRFGHRAVGDIGELERLMRSYGGVALGVPLKEVNSTHIRRLISAGEVGEAARLLGRSYVLRGEVAVGDKRGRTIGFPTANVVPDPAVLIPARGVYAGFARVGKHEYAACTNVGIAPTFGRGESKVESYLLDFEGDLYGETVDVSFARRIRSEKRFSGIDELKAQIVQDVEKARRIADDMV